jgi:hypothetical protein
MKSPMTSLFLESLPQPWGGWNANKSLQATATALSVLTMIARLNIIIASEARLPWLCLSF